MKKKKEISISQKFLLYKWRIIFCALFVVLLFTRFYGIEQYNSFGWDQVDNAWAVKHILIDHQVQLTGMVAKGNSGIFIGPFYYYLISGVYFLTKLDPIASGIFAGITALFTFFVIFYVVKKLFNTQVALIAVLINTVAFFGISFDRVQWPVNFIPALSLLVFYSLYKVITGNPKFLLLFAAAFGFSLHIHFTSVFYPIFFVLALPFFPRKKETLIYSAYALLIFVPFIVPLVMYNIQSHGGNTNHTAVYLGSYYHGFHIRRVVQIIGDAFIQFEPYLFFAILKPLKYLLPILFSILYLHKQTKDRNQRLFVYLLWMWFIVPWFVFATYKGEISDYYYAVNRFIVLIVISYLLYQLFAMKNIALSSLVMVALLLYSYINISSFFHQTISNSLAEHRKYVINAINSGQKLHFIEGNADYYLYYIKTTRNL